MPNFIFKSIDKKGVIKEGEIQAYSKLEAMDYLTRQDLTIISLVEKGEILKFKFNFRLKGVTTADKILLVRNLSSMIKTGISLPETLDILIANTDKKIVRKILVEAKLNLQQGKPFSSTFESWPQYFSKVFIGFIKAGEISGNLEKTLEFLEAQLVKDDELIKKIKSAMIYPATLLITSLVIIFVLIYFVVPRLSELFLESGLGLHPLTKVVLKISEILNYSTPINVSILILLILLFIYLFKFQRGQMLLVSIFFYLPGARALIKKIALAHFTGILNNLLSAGIPISESLINTAEAINQTSYKKAILGFRESIKKGSSITELLQKRKDLFPPLIVSMISVGERTGTLEKALKTIAVFYSEDVDRTLKNLVGLIEPALLLIMGIIVGGIALSVLIPIYSLIGTIS